MDNRTEFAKVLEECMRTLRFDLDVLKVQASEDEATVEMSDRIYELQEKLDTFELRLRDLSQAPPQIWPKLKVLASKALEDASSSIQMAKQRYLH